MLRQDLQFTYPEDLVAVHPAPVSRVLVAEVHDKDPRPQLTEIPFTNIHSLFRAGDVLVVNDTRVLRRRVFSENGDEFLFLESSADLTEWSVLFPAKAYRLGARFRLPQGVELVLLEKGRPQKVRSSRPLDHAYFEGAGEWPLPPYIQKARQERHARSADANWYQSAWAEVPGSLASPTASLHFKAHDLEALRARGVEILTLTLHVGLGTFLPVTSENLDEHTMHSEEVEVSFETWRRVQAAKREGRRVWALGTTVTRALESVACGKLHADGPDRSYRGATDLLIQPGFQFQVLDVLMTNFHQPESTLLALVAAWAGLGRVHFAYQWAIEQRFRLFSYGDLSIWLKT
jgi:S-adenosylmethionine:tRNA ribosyltransferase-isomerase